MSWKGSERRPEGALACCSNSKTSSAHGPAAFTIQVFSNLACNPSGYGEGKWLLASFILKTNGQGNAAFTHTLAKPVPAGRIITATATDPKGDTSQFSRCIKGA